jgi:hypothetical protein
LRVGELLECVDAAAREEGRVDFEGRVLGGCADEADGTALDPGKEGVLLCAVEAMNFVDEQDGACAPGSGLLRVGHDLFDFFYAGEYGGEFDEGGLCGFGDDFRQRGLADTGRSPENHRRRIVALDLYAKRLAWAEKVLLTEELVEGTGTHALGKGSRYGRGLRAGRRGEKAHRRVRCRAAS